MWSHVKFTGDGIVHNVKTSYFKEVVEGQVEPKDLKVNNLYLVFWSPDPKESPQKILAQGNEIMDMSSKTRLTKKGPLKGYYEAILLDLKQSEGTLG